MELVTQVAVPLLVSVCGGAASMYVAFQVLQHRVASLEARVIELDREAKRQSKDSESAIGEVRTEVGKVRDDLSDVRASVKAIEGYMRGAAEARKAHE